MKKDKEQDFKFVKINPERYPDDANYVIDTIASILNASKVEFNNTNKVGSVKYEIEPSPVSNGSEPCFKQIMGVSAEYEFVVKHIFPQNQNSDEVESLYVSLENKTDPADNVEFSSPWHKAHFKQNIVLEINDFINKVYRYDENSHKYVMRARGHKKSIWEQIGAALAPKHARNANNENQR